MPWLHHSKPSLPSWTSLTLLLDLPFRRQVISLSFALNAVTIDFISPNALTYPFNCFVMDTGTSLPNYVASKVAAEQGFGNQAVSNAFGRWVLVGLMLKLVFHAVAY